MTTFASTIGTGFASAATATIGHAIGGGNEEDVNVYRRWSYIESAVSMTIVTILCFFSPWKADGNSRFPMMTTMIGIWGIRTLGVYLFAWRLGPKIQLCLTIRYFQYKILLL